MDGSVQSYRNRLLELLDPKDLDRLRPHLKPTIFDYRQSLYEANSPIPSVYFPIDGVASLVNTMANGSAAEVGTIVNEGIVGLPVIFGDRYAPTSAYIQVPGSGLRLQADVLSSELIAAAQCVGSCFITRMLFLIKSRNQPHAITSIPSSSDVAAGY